MTHSAWQPVCAAVLCATLKSTFRPSTTFSILGALVIHTNPDNNQAAFPLLYFTKSIGAAMSIFVPVDPTIGKRVIPINVYPTFQNHWNKLVVVAQFRQQIAHGTLLGKTDWFFNFSITPTRTASTTTVASFVTFYKRLINKT